MKIRMRHIIAGILLAFTIGLFNGSYSLNDIVYTFNDTFNDTLNDTYENFLTFFRLDRLYPYEVMLKNNPTEQDYIRVVKYDGYFLRTIKNQTQKICNAAVRNKPGAIRFAQPQFQTTELGLYVVGADPYLLKFITNKTEPVCIKAVRLDGLTMSYLNREQQTEAVIMAALKEQRPYPHVYTGNYPLQYIIDQTEEHCLIAINNHPNNFWYCRNQTYNVTKLAIKKDAFQIKYVNNQTANYEELCYDALRQFPSVIRYIKNPTPEMIEYAHNNSLSNIFTNKN